jgi:hypothetical protein
MEVIMRYVVVVRGQLKGSKADAQKVHDATIGQISPQSRQMGSTGHQAYLNTADEKGFLAVDFWDNIEAIQKLYSDPALAAEFGKLFDGQPEVTIWADAGWMGY